MAVNVLIFKLPGGYLNSSTSFAKKKKKIIQPEKRDNFEINRIMQTIDAAYLNNAVNLLVVHARTHTHTRTCVARQRGYVTRNVSLDDSVVVRTS